MILSLPATKLHIPLSQTQLASYPHPIKGLRRDLELLVLLVVVALLATACDGSRSPVSFEPTVSSMESVAKTEPLSLMTSLSRHEGRPRQAISFRRLTPEDGLSQSTINCIVQDAQGFMWFGTQDGLNRYDGYEIKVYRYDSENPHSLSDGFVLSCERDQRGVVWLVTRGGVLHRYEPETERFIRYTLALEDPFQLMGSEFTSLHGDAEGRLWIGTHGDGLVRYDPDEDSFRYYRHDSSDPTSLSHRVVSHVYEDHEGVIWVGTEAGLNRYDVESDSFVRYPYRDFPPGAYQYDAPVHDYDPAFQPDNAHALASPAVTYLLEDREGRLWVGTRYGGLNRFDGETGRFTSYAYDPAHEPANANSFSGNSVRELLEDRLGHIWVTSADWNLDETRTYARLGLERLDPDTDTITRYEANPDDACSLPHQAVLRMVEDSRGTLLIHTFAGGLDVYDPSTGCFVHYAHDPDDARTLSGDDITRLYEDNAGGLWIGTAMGGVSYHDATWAKFPSYRVGATGGERLSNDSVWRIAPSWEGLSVDGHAYVLWISTFAGLNRWDRRANLFTFYEIDPRLPDVLAYAIFEDVERQALWLGTSMGLDRADLPADGSTAPEALEFSRVLTRSSASAGLVADLQPAEGDMLWLARYQVGLSRLDLATREIVATYRHDPDDERSLGDDRVTDITLGQDRSLWLVTRSGIDRFDLGKETFTHYLHDPGDPRSVAERVYALYQDSTGTVWLGTGGQGLQRLNPVTGRVTVTYQEEDGLPNNVVYSILPDESGRLWLSTNKGLARFDPETETFQSYTVRDGLQSNEFNLGAQFRAPDGELFFGGVSGVNAFYPHDIAPNPFVPPIVITEVLLGPPKPPRGGSTPVRASPSGVSEATPRTPPYFTERIELSYRDRILSFEFAALHYAIPERNQYAYVMEGFDSDWHYVGNRRFATYTNLPAGRYTFRVKGSNSDGVWNERGASLTILVAPPLWATWWFRGVVGLLLVGGVVAGSRLRVRSIQARSRELEVQVAERTEELAAVNAIAAVLSRSLDLDDILADALEKTLQVMEIEAGGIYLLDEKAATLTVVAQQGFSPQFVAGVDGLRVGEGFSGRVAESGQPLLVKDVSADPRLTRMVAREEGLRSLAVVPLSSKGRVLGTLFTVTHGYREFTGQDIQLLTSIGQQIGVAVENARLYEAEQRRAEQFRVITEVGRRIASILPLNTLLDQMARLIQEAFDYYHVAIGLIEGDEVVYHAGAGVLWDDPEFELHPARLKVGQEGITGWVASTGEPMLVSDVSQEPRYVWMEGSETRSELAVPIKAKGEVIGVLDVQSDQSSAFDESDLSVLQSMAHQAAIAVENVRLYEQAQQLAVVRERQRLARELHDAVTQTLFSASLIAETLPALWESDQEGGRQLLQELRQLSRGALAEMRTLLMELRPAVLVDADLGDLLHQLAEAAAGRTGVPVAVTVEGRCDLPGDVHVALYRMGQEALNNVVKHAQAANVTVGLHCLPPGDSVEDRGSVELRVSDDGRGFDMRDIEPGELGLGIMYERAQSIGAELNIASQPGQGTQVTIVWRG